MHTLRTFRLGCALLGAALLLAPIPAVAQVRAATPTLAAEDHYREGAFLLRQGQSFSRAIAAMQKAVDAEPTSAGYQAGLGCAFASRAASVALAASHINRHAADRERYRQHLEVWNKRRESRGSAAIAPKSSPANAESAETKLEREFWRVRTSFQERIVSSPTPPLPPPDLCTRDDRRRFTFTEQEATGEVERLSKAALDAWDRAVRVAHDDRERREALYTRAWGSLVLLRAARRLKATPPREPQAVRDDFATLTQEAPENAVYWQSLGDALSDWGVGSAATNDRAAAFAPYLRALRLAPDHSTLAFHLLSRQGAYVSQKRYKDPGVESDITLPPIAPNGNGLLAYYKAATLALDGDVQAAQVAKITELLEQGNRDAVCVIPRYERPVPKLLRAAWQYDSGDEDTTYYLLSLPTELFRGIRQYAQREGAPGRTTNEVLQLCLAIQTASERMSRCEEDGDLPPPKRRLLHLAANVLQSGSLNLLKQVYRWRGDTAAEDAVRERQKTFEAASSARLDYDMGQITYGYGDY